MYFRGLFYEESVLENSDTAPCVNVSSGTQVKKELSSHFKHPYLS